MHEKTRRRPIRERPIARMQIRHELPRPAASYLVWTRAALRWLVLLLLTLPASAVLADASAVPVGGQFQVNTYTTDVQIYPSVSMGSDGGFLVAWASAPTNATDTSSLGIQAQRYASDGSVLGGEFQVNAYTTQTQSLPSVSADSDGGFVVVWDSLGSSGTDSSSASIQGQRYASDGSALGGEFQINTYTETGQTRASVSVGPDGGFVVVWEGFASGGTDSLMRSVHRQRYASGGSALGGELQVNTYTSGDQRAASVSVGPDGGFVVVWESDGSSGTDTSGDSIQGQRYASDGSALGGEFQVNTFTSEYQSGPSVSVGPDGGFVVVWESDGSSGTDTSGDSIQGQRYASDGSALAGEFQVNTYTTYSQRSASVSVSSEGDFAVVWQRTLGPDDPGVQGQLYASDGSALGGEFQVDTYTTALGNPSVSVAPSGGFVVVWEGTDGSYTGVHGQRYLDGCVFADGFESGDTSSWSSSTTP